MASNPNKANISAAAAAAAASSYDKVVLQALLSRLQLRPPYLSTDSVLSHSLDDFPLRDDGEEEEEEEEEDEEEEEEEEENKEERGAKGSRNRRLLAKEEAKLEKEIHRIIRSGDAVEALKANSGQSVAIGDHNICVSVHDEPDSEYRVWEWHGHIMLFDEEDGYSAEYIYGNYFERPDKKTMGGKKQVVDEGDEEDSDDNSKIKTTGNSGLKQLIEEPKDSIVNRAGSVLHRKFLKDGTSQGNLQEKKDDDQELHF